jgi:glycosyltransferase involved in cell wall biosynthesis
MNNREHPERPMRVLFVGKRFYTNRDAYKEHFGRIYQLPYWWARAGHEVDLWLIDYHGRDVEVTKDRALTVETTPVLRWRFFVKWISVCSSRLRVRRPDIVVASGDCYIGLVAYVAAFFSGAKFVFDVYDRYDVFEGYRRLPGFDPLNFLLRRAWIATFASSKVRYDLNPMTNRAVLVPNGVDLSRFTPLPMLESRKQFGLPEGTALVGYFGSMEPERGVEDLIAAVEKLIGDGVEVSLVIGGKADPNINFEYPWLHYLGNIEFSKMPEALASCDVLALPYRQGSFVDNASSCKIAEYMAMERPIVSTRSPNLVQNFPEQAAQLDGLLATPGDVKELARCLRMQLSERRLVDMPKGMSWQEIGDSICETLEKLIAG